MASVAIRLALREERAALEELQRRASLEHEDYRAQLLAHPDAINLPLEQILRGEVLVAELGNRLTGFAVVLPGDGVAELDGLFVEPDQWRRGIGRALVDAANLQARQQGLGPLSVVANPTAIAFYESCGFAPQGKAETRFGPAMRMSR